jgi:uncharacterized membrane protein YfhO
MWNGAAIRVLAPRPALLVPGIIGPAGWTAWNGKERLRVVSAGGHFAAVPCPAGTTTVDLRYRPLPFGLGLLVSAVAAATLLVSALLPAYSRAL